MAAVAGVLVAMMGILPTFRARLGATATGTSAFAAVEPLATTLVNQAVQPLAYLGLAPLVVNAVYLFADATGQLPTGRTDPEGDI